MSTPETVTEQAPEISIADARENMLDARVEGPLALGMLRDRVAADAALMEIARHVPLRHFQQGNLQSLFFHGVLFLAAKQENRRLLGAVAELVGEDRLREETFVALRGFALDNGPALRALLGRAKQTNNVTRSAALLPAFCLAGQWADAPIALIELGPSAGINLCWDHFAYDYGDLGRHGRSGAACSISYRILDGLPAASGASPRWLPDLSSPPEVASRCGLELAPVRLDSADELLWLKCWSAGIDAAAMARFDAAIDVVRAVRPTIRPGDALEGLSRAVDEVSSGVVPCIYSSFMAYQLEPAARTALTQALERVGRRRRSVYLSLGDTPAPRGARLDIAYLDPSGSQRDVLGYCDAVGDAGTSLTWLGGATPGARRS